MGDQYFKAYEDIEIQRLMLDDKPRTESYKKAIFGAKNKIEGKVVLDVGTGTGILSIFCAKAGAKKVYAVEASNMAKLAKDVVKENDLDDRIEVHHCLVQDLNLPEKVDVIVSEWMGYFLFHEGMLSAVIEARDKFLKDDGFLIPESADLWIAPCKLPRFFDYWNDVYGIKMNTLGKYQRENQKEPVVTDVDKQDLIAEPSVVKSVVLKTITNKELKEFRYKTLVPSEIDGKYQGLCMWFVCNFALDNDEDFVFLDTKPGQPQTHWKQTAIVYPFEITVEKGDPIAFELYFRNRLDDPRKYAIEVTMLDPEKEEHPTPVEKASNGENLAVALDINK
ncbi:protein arginine N-methyltransferase, putative [Pediculus humanus corporis]|uniref:Protein arginine N-methyltransferase, putative n=1 Tax=Pediculus humanus subsp. corporis TaxID=121224 RepID=E0VT46_PEDHC|nr:protein arginine N-methyltransferase, putative [Pediculus humanus corporis]EEB16552.1 protein arginine N-methyltransferase, putative [Pediculus humanus corporis]